jgi:N-methylhydantoinase A
VLTVDIDVGGTLTDGIFTRDGEVVCAKVDTTAHDLTVCLFDCLTQGARQFGYGSLDGFLGDVDLIRWSTTITSNILAEQRGPRLGLIVSRGHEADLYGSTPRSLLLDRLVAGPNIIGIEPSTSDGDVMTAVRGLLENGVRRICVSLENAHRDPSGEIRIKKIIDQQYPDHFLGSVPVLAGSDISPTADDMTRTCCALINAYTHGALAAALFKAEDELRQTCGYLGTFLVSHINGGASGIAKARAIDTIESGPILGIHGSSHAAKALGIHDVVALDVGGTTAKAAILAGGEPIYKKPSDLFGISVGLSLPYLRSIALGGGSCVRPVAESAEPSVTLGPESMGSYPGPACYGLGGNQATLTDAFVGGGLINPDYFLGGAKKIDLELARRTIQEQVAEPLKISLEDACRTVIHAGFQSVAELIASVSKDLGKSLSGHVLFAYGGNGGLFACGVAELAGLNRVHFFGFGSVFSAFGSSVSDICHIYERSLYVNSMDGGALERIFAAVADMKREGIKDLLGEGLQPEGLSYTVELDTSNGTAQSSRTVSCSESIFQSADLLMDHLTASLKIAGKQNPAISIDVARLQMKKSMAKYVFSKRAGHGPDSSQARKGTRKVAWGSKTGEARLYSWESLQPGNRVEGCAILEGSTSTYLVPEGWVLEMDPYGNAALHREGN